MGQSKSQPNQKAKDAMPSDIDKSNLKQNDQNRPQQSKVNIPTTSQIRKTTMRKRDFKVGQTQLHVQQFELEKVNYGELPEELQKNEYKGKNIKKFNLEAVIEPKDLLKASNYFDESQDGNLHVSKLRNVGDSKIADYRMGQLGDLNTFQVKTYLFDRNLTHKIVAT